jgi:hypothetical protein
MTISMKKIIFSILILPFVSCSQHTEQEIIPMDSTLRDTLAITSFYNPEYYQKFDNKWTELEDGLHYIEMDGPRKENIGDSKISLLKINPEKFQFEMLSATQFDSTSKCVSDWARDHQLNVVINAGMYDLRRQLSSKGLLQNSKSYANNPNYYEGYNMLIAFNPLDKSLPAFDIFDLKCADINQVKKKYASLAQGMRMIDCNGAPMSWNKNPQWCSQLIVAKDKHQNIYFVFTRSPYSHNEMIQFMVNLKEPLMNAIYMEGGPQTSLYIDTKNDHIEKLGSYVSRTYATDKNAEFWNLPNIIGIRKK